MYFTKFIRPSRKMRTREKRGETSLTDAREMLFVDSGMRAAKRVGCPDRTVGAYSFRDFQLAAVAT